MLQKLVYILDIKCSYISSLVRLPKMFIVIFHTFSAKVTYLNTVMKYFVHCYEIFCYYSYIYCRYIVRY